MRRKELRGSFHDQTVSAVSLQEGTRIHGGHDAKNRTYRRVYFRGLQRRRGRGKRRGKNQDESARRRREIHGRQQ